MDTPSTLVDNTKTQRDAARVADAYFKFPLAGTYAFWGGEAESQKVVDKFYPGYAVEAQPYQQVFTNDETKSTIVNFNGTETPGDAWQGWGEAASPVQTAVASTASSAVDAAADILGLSTYYQAFKSGGSFLADKLTADVPNLDQRVEQGKALVDRIREERPDHHILLTGYSLGGLVAQRVSESSGNRLDALLFNSAVGKHTVNRDVEKRTIEFRISGDAVSTRFDGSPQFTFEKKTEIARGMFSSFEKLLTDTDRIGQPTDPIQSHWIENFALSRQRFHDQLMSENPTVNTRSPMNVQPIVTPQHDLFSVGLQCKPCPKGKVFCRCDLG
tara:strand:+ start:4619 stop:5608 length:990 start_codon:yes stop_codon:yes gene_type:complete